jgi:hypothetical protein
MMPVVALAADTSQQASDSAKAWLTIIDAGNYSQSWKDAGSSFQSAVTEAKWAEMAKPIRDSVGALLSRVPAGVEQTKSLPSAPPGDYAVVRFSTKFANKSDATETVIMLMDGGAWKVAGYFIK